MFSREEASALRRQFWTSFGKSFPRKWIFHRTKIRGLAFKFDADRKHLHVILEISSNDPGRDELLWEQVYSLRNLINAEIPDLIYDDSFRLESGKTCHRVYCVYPEKFSIYNKNTWQKAYEFMYDRMQGFEEFFYEYRDYIAQADI